MTNSILKRAVMMSAAVTTTLGIFSAVASLGDNDKAALIAAQSVRGTHVAAVNAPAR